MNKKSIGLFGGSFDPPHRGHLLVSKKSIKELGLKKLYWIVTNKSPFKKKTFFSLKKRINESKILTKKSRLIKVKYLDKLVKSSRTIDTIKYLIKRNKNCNFFLIVGSDNLINFHKWKSYKKY